MKMGLVIKKQNNSTLFRKYVSNKQPLTDPHQNAHWKRARKSLKISHIGWF